jgi:hypothetical protein
MMMLSFRYHFANIKGFPMSALLIRDLPEELHRVLKQRAAQNRRSMAKEAMHLLELALTMSGNTPPDLPPPFVGNFPLTDDWLDQAKQAGRA